MADTTVPSTLTPEVNVKKALPEKQTKQNFFTDQPIKQCYRIDRLRTLLGKK